MSKYKLKASHSIWCFLFISFFAIAGSGCTPAPAEQKYEVVIPEELNVDGATWKKHEWTEQITKRVTNYLRKTPYLADNPNFTGQQVCYSDGSGKDRCYWVQAAGDSSQWIMIEFRGSKGSQLVEGIGEPFGQMRERK